jgi:hypothetical protein
MNHVSLTRPEGYRDEGQEGRKLLNHEETKDTKEEGEGRIDRKILDFGF